MYLVFLIHGQILLVHNRDREIAPNQNTVMFSFVSVLFSPLGFLESTVLRDGVYIKEFGLPQNHRDVTYLRSSKVKNAKPVYPLPLDN